MIHDSRTQERFWAKVNKSAGCWLWTGCVMKRGYGQLMCFYGGEKKIGYAHRISFEIHNGAIPSGLVIDHTCYTRSCVNPAHLRAIPQRGNVENRGPLHSRNTSGYRGVSWDKARDMWTAQVGKDGKNHNVGRYKTREEAAEAARLKRLELETYNDMDRAA